MCCAHDDRDGHGRSSLHRVRRGDDRRCNDHHCGDDHGDGRSSILLHDRGDHVRSIPVLLLLRNPGRARELHQRLNPWISSTSFISMLPMLHSIIGALRLIWCSLSVKSWTTSLSAMSTLERSIVCRQSQLGTALLQIR